MHFRRLEREDDRPAFSCGDAAIDRFFQDYAGQNQFRHQIGVTWLLEDQGVVAAFVTVASHGLRLPEGLRAGLPAYPVPVLLIARMGVDRRFQGQGLGRRLLVECCGLALQQGEIAGCAGLLTDAKPGAIGFYRRYGFVPVAEPEEDGTQTLLLARRHFEALVRARDAMGDPGP